MRPFLSLSPVSREVNALGEIRFRAKVSKVCAQQGRKKKVARTVACSELNHTRRSIPASRYHVHRPTSLATLSDNTAVAGSRSRSASQGLHAAPRPVVGENSGLYTFAHLTSQTSLSSRSLYVYTYIYIHIHIRMFIRTRTIGAFRSLHFGN